MVEPYANLCLAVLREAKIGNTEMWQDFRAEYNVRKEHHNSFQIALWVAGWWRAHEDLSRPPLHICPRCNIETYKEMDNCDICGTELVRSKE